MQVNIRVIYEKINDLEKSILKNLGNRLINLHEQLDRCEKDSEEYELISQETEVTNEIYFSILDEFINHGKAIEEVV